MMAKDLPSELIGQIQSHTGFPWWNGEAYAENKGYPQRIRTYERSIGEAIDDLADVIELLRADGKYAEADRIRTIAGRMARTLPGDEAHLVRVAAKGWK